MTRGGVPVHETRSYVTPIPLPRCRPEGNTFRDPSLKELGDYYGRLLAHYTEGGFMDEGGLWVPVRAPMRGERRGAGHAPASADGRLEAALPPLPPSPHPLRCQGFNYTISHWEVLNEIESEHHSEEETQERRVAHCLWPRALPPPARSAVSPATYTQARLPPPLEGPALRYYNPLPTLDPPPPQVYDAIVAGIRRWAPRGSASMKFVGLALESDELSYVDYFLNASNHAPGTPLDMISFHFYAQVSLPPATTSFPPTPHSSLPPFNHVYAQPSVRDGGANASAYEQMFSSAAGWLNTVQNIVDARDAINPSVSSRGGPGGQWGGGSDDSSELTCPQYSQ